jgi:hypothetical protein
MNLWGCPDTQQSLIADEWQRRLGEGTIVNVPLSRQAKVSAGAGDDAATPPRYDALHLPGMPSDMSTPKTEVAELLSSLPDSASYEDIQYHLYILEKIRRGVGRAESEGALSHEEARKRLGRWVTN